MLTNIQSKSHPKHYLMHKYWGRKAHNLVAEYILYYTKPGELVLDPFMGSGGVVIESKKHKRRSIGVDINPITKLIVENTICEINPDLILEEIDKIVAAIPNEVKVLSLTKCPQCGAQSKLQNAVWNGNLITRVKGMCPNHKQFIKDADEFDFEKAKTAARLLKKYAKSPGFYYPQDRILDFVRRNGKKHIHELFTERNLLQSALILQHINRIKNPNLKNLYSMAFTSMLPNISSMIPANETNATGKSGWQISKFWVPNIHTEKNVFESLRSRITLIHKGKVETQNTFSSAKHEVHIRSAENLGFIEDNAIDYIFTDPPYGDSIAYLGLSMFWNSWLRYTVDYEAEIIHDPYRQKGHGDYSTRLTNVFEELYRVLKPGKQMSFTFHNRYVKFWSIVMDAVSGSGFELEDITWHAQAVASGTQGINRRNTLKGDFVYTFKKPLKHKGVKNELLPYSEGEQILLEHVSGLFAEYDFLETAKIYEHVIPVIVRKRAFLDSQGGLLDIDKVLKKNFQYREVELGNKKAYGWAKI